MKKNLFTMLAAGVITLATTNRANAQNPGNPAIAAGGKNITTEWQATAANAPTVTSAYRDDACAKVLKKLSRMHKNVPVENWIKTEDGYSAKFYSKGVKNTVFYDTDGNWAGSLKNYSADKLSVDIKNVVKHKYHNYNIVSVDEIETTDSNDVPTYIIHLEGENTFKVIRFYDGQTEIRQEFEKS